MPEKNKMQSLCLDGFLRLVRENKDLHANQRTRKKGFMWGKL
jgi:hypothetical protein